MPLPDPSRVPRPWLAAYPPGVPPTYAYPDVPLTRFLDDAARDFPGVTATWFRGATIDYAELLDLVDRCATALGELGIGRGDRVAVVLPNLPAAVIALFAALRIGAIAVPCDLEADDDTLLDRLRSSGAEVALCDVEVAERINRLRARLRHLRHVVVTARGDWSPAPRSAFGRVRSRLRRASSEPSTPRRLSDLIRAADPIAKQEPIDRDEPAVIRSSDRPSEHGLVLTHGNLTASAFQLRLWVPDAQAGRERILVAPPFGSHTTTVAALAGVLSAATLVLCDERQPAAVMDAIVSTRPTLVVGPPDLFEGLVAHRAAGRRDLRSIRIATCDGPVDAATAQRFEGLTGARLRRTFAAAGASVTHADPVYGRPVVDSIGLPVTDTVAVVVDDDGRPCPSGDPGRLVVSGPQVPSRYWGPPPDGVSRRDGWLVTDDRAVVGEDGYFRLVV